MHKDISQILITEEEIQAKVAELGEQIAHDYRAGDALEVHAIDAP